MDAGLAAIQFALSTEDGLAFLRLWNEGEFDLIRRDWPDAPEAVFVGADPLHPLTRVQSEVSEKYIKSGGYECPHCGERDVMTDGPVDPDHMTAHQQVKCVACGALWDDVWELVGCDNIVPPT